jgi:preprotein translocase subunit SecF
MRFFKFTDIDFIKNRRKFFVIFGMLFLVTMYFIIRKGGVNYGIDFTGGVLMHVSFQNKVNLKDVRSAVEECGINSFELQSSDNIIIIRVKKNIRFQEELKKSIQNSVQSKFPNNLVKIERMEYVGPTVGKYLSKQAVYAFLFAFLGMVAYIAFRFKSSFWGIVAILGVVHDIVVTFGFVVFLGKEVNITVVAALLTIAGYSINDTIVLFDRIKENLKLIINHDLAVLINVSINDVLARTITTSLTVFIVACSLFFFGGEVMHTFAYAIIIGTTLGVFSTLFICAPLIYEYGIKKNKRIRTITR